VHQALDLPAAERARDQLVHLRLLEQRAVLACASIGRLIGDPHCDALDCASEADHILHQLADLASATRRRHAEETCLPADRAAGSTRRS
jgi:hypothetical protein